MKYLSFSAYQKYITCPHSYDLYYNKRIRPIGTPAHLPFGSAIDVGLNQLLLQDPNYYRVCKRETRKLLAKGVTFSPFDFDGELLGEKERALLQRALRMCARYPGDTPDQLVKALFYKISKGDVLTANQQKALAIACTISLREKAKLMFESYKRTVLPKIKKVHKVQEYVNWSDAEGNKYTGVIDLLCEMHGFEGLVLPDHKTSSMYYEEDAALTSMQLAVYAHVLKPTWVGFIVLNKQIKKNRVKTCAKCGNDGTGKRHKTCDFETDFGRCNGDWIETVRPEATIQILINKIPARNSEIAVDALEQTHKGITNGVFPRNLNVCKNIYGKPCPNIKLCWEGKMDGLETKPEGER
jgi:hypothetical protein